MAASITFDAVATNTTANVTDGATRTISLTVAAASGQERLVVLSGIGKHDASDPDDFTACTIDGQTATRVGTAVHGVIDAGNYHAFTTVYRANGTSNTSINVVVTDHIRAFGQIFDCTCACYKLTGAGTLLAQSSGTGTPPITLNLNTVTDGVVVGGLICYSDSSLSSFYTGMTETFDSVSIYGDDLRSGGCANVSSGATPRTVSIAISGTAVTPGGTTDSLAAICLSLNPAAGGAVDVSVTTNLLTTSVGAVVASGASNVTTTTNLLTTSVGAATVQAKASVTVNGQVVTAAVDQATVTGKANVSPTTNLLTTSVSGVTATAGATASVTTNLLTASVGQVTVNAIASVQVNVTGNLLSMSVGQVLVSADGGIVVPVYARRKQMLSNPPRMMGN